MIFEDGRNGAIPEMVLARRVSRGSPPTAEKTG